MQPPLRLTGLAASRLRLGERADRAVRIAAFFTHSDTVADAAVDALAQLPSAEGRELMTRALDSGIAAVPDAPDALVALFRQVEHVPFWVDFERCKRGGEAFFRAGALGGIALGFGALARAYCSAGGNKPLTFTRDLIDRAPQRIAETAAYVRAVSQPDGLRRGQPGFRASVQVRLLHARVRMGLLRSPRWRAEDWGVPINQADTAMTALLFSHGLAEGVRRLGGRMSDRAEGDLIHLWRYAGYLLGVDEELLCTSVEDARLMADLVDAIDGGPDEDSRKLIMAMLTPESFEAKIKDPAVAKHVREIYIAACRALIGDAHADRIGLPAWSGHNLAFKHLLRPAIRAVGRVAAFVPGSSERFARMGHAYWESFTKAADSTRQRQSGGRARWRAEIRDSIRRLRHASIRSGRLAPACGRR